MTSFFFDGEVFLSRREEKSAVELPLLPGFLPMRPVFYLRVAFAAWLFVCGGATLAADGPASPMTIGVFGDSLGVGVWSGLYTVLKKHPEDKLIQYAKVGAGLTRPDYFSWFGEFTQKLDEDHITVAVIMFGANDQQSLRDEAQKGFVFQSEGWKRNYSGRVDAILAELAKRKIKAIWIGIPILRKEELNKGADYLNEIFLDSSKKAGSDFLPLTDDFKGPDGGFASHLPDSAGHLKQVRADDGVHFTPWGYQLVAEKVYGVLAPSH